jgi:hypothetical protein
LLSSSRCSHFSLWLNPCPFLQERFYTEAEEVEKDVTINVTNEFDPYDDYGGRSNNVRHVDRSGLPQFTATEETVIGLNESREVFRCFEKIGGFDDAPVQFMTIAKKFIWKYQRVLTKKASVKAILCDRRYSAGKLPPKLKPGIIRQEYNQYTNNWFLVEYMTLPRRSTASIRRHQNDLLRKKSARKKSGRADRSGLMMQEIFLAFY